MDQIISIETILRRDQEKLFHAEVSLFKHELIRKVLAGLSPPHLDLFQRIYGYHIECIPEESLAAAYALAIGSLSKQSKFFTPDAPDISDDIIYADDTTRWMRIIYTNHLGATEERDIIPREFFYGTMACYSEVQWFVRAFCLCNQDNQCFSLAGIKEWKTYKPCP